MQFSDLVSVSNDVARARGRLDKTARLAELVKRLEPDEVTIAVAFLSGSLLQGRIGIGWSLIAQARNAVAAGEPSLTLREVHEAFDRIAATGGSGATRKRSSILSGLFARATSDEQEFLGRLLSGDLRQGALEGVLMEAIAKATGITAGTIRHAAMMCGDLTEVARAAIADGPGSLARFAIQLFRPVEPMLASPAESVSEALQILGVAAFELKLDGARIQVHKSGSDVRVFSRALRDVTAAVPDVVELVRVLPARELILDGEVIALRPDGAPLPFQETMRRFGRRLDVEQLRSELPLTPFFFDCLYVDGQQQTSQPQRARFNILSTIASHLSVAHRILDDKDAAAGFFKAAIEGGHEGLVAKSLDAPYSAGTRGSAWLKIKQVRTLDLVVLAAEWGNGRRRGWLSNLHLAARDPDRNRFVMLGKTFKGLTDELLEWQTAALLERETGREGHIVHVSPELVVEVAFNDLQESPQYPGGLALRFARVKRYRPDKTAEDADTLETLQSIYRSMTGRPPPAPRQ
jgi:DNA ligase 1